MGPVAGVVVFQRPPTHLSPCAFSHARWICSPALIVSPEDTRDSPVGVPRATPPGNYMGGVASPRTCLPFARSASSRSSARSPLCRSPTSRSTKSARSNQHSVVTPRSYHAKHSTATSLSPAPSCGSHTADSCSRGGLKSKKGSKGEDEQCTT